MSLPRAILPGKTYLLTRRCTQRQFLLRPDKKTNQAYLYCLGEAAQRYGIEVLAFDAMSNHDHVVIRDPHGRLPEFARQFHQVLAKVLNVRWSRWENLWSSEPPTYTELIDPGDVFDACVYTLLNPSAAGLVDHIGDWPGASSFPLHHGAELTVERPSFFFRKNGTMPKNVTLRLGAPPRGEDAAVWNARLLKAVAHGERQARDARAAAGKRIVGRKAVRAASPFDTPKTSTPRRKLRPMVACKNQWRRIRALGALTSFRAAYRAAWARLMDGHRDIVFPRGTYALARLGIIRCAPS